MGCDEVQVCLSYYAKIPGDSLHYFSFPVLRLKVVMEDEEMVWLEYEGSSIVNMLKSCQWIYWITVDLCFANMNGWVDFFLLYFLNCVWSEWLSFRLQLWCAWSIMQDTACKSEHLPVGLVDMLMFPGLPFFVSPFIINYAENLIIINYFPWELCEVFSYEITLMVNKYCFV